MGKKLKKRVDQLRIRRIMGIKRILRRAIVQTPVNLYKQQLPDELQADVTEFHPFG